MTEVVSVYHQLRYEIDTRTANFFPSSDSGLEIQILKQIFTPLEAQIAIQLSALPEGLKRIHKRVTKSGIDISIQDLENLLDGLVRKGGIIYEKLLFNKPKKKMYGLVQFVIGIYEMQVDKLTKGLAEDTEQYLQETFIHSFQNTGDHKQLRTIPVNRSIAVDRYVDRYDNIKELVMRERGPFVVINCICKQAKDLLEEPCKLTDSRNVCITIGYSAKGSLDLFPSAKEVSKEELFELLDEFQDIGFVLQPGNCFNPKSICVCCGCCCGALSNIKKLPRPADFWVSNYYAQVNTDLCNGCGMCFKRCQIEAVKIVNKKSTINLDRCIGCGNCVIKCKTNAIILLQKEKTTKPNRFHKGLYLNFFRKKRGLWGFLKMLGLYLFGQRV
ncbi:MAG: 4Fe-4S binding protein [Candidatus Heimdallarchaeota archaeon]|nr:4Fe-4S binding protein [Candidatus Heimdallarchaeota archaeon]